MPRLKKTSPDMRRRNAKHAIRRYREKYGDSLRERNRIWRALRRMDEGYRLEQNKKSQEARRRKKLNEQRAKKDGKRKKLLEKKNAESPQSIIIACGYKEIEIFPKFENCNLHTDFPVTSSGMSFPLPEKKSLKFNPNAVKRGRGRPRKDSLASNISNPHNSSFLEEDLQCSTDDDEDGFQEVSEDENNPASFLDQAERMHSMSNAGGSDGSDLIDAAHIKTEMKIEPTQISGEDSMDLDPNYDPSDFLTMHSRMGSNENNEQQQVNKMSQFLQHDEGNNENLQSTNQSKSNIHQMPLIMGSNDNMGIDDDLAISESDEEDNGNVRVKREIFTDQMDDEQQQQQEMQQQSLSDIQMQQKQQQEQFPIQPYVDIDGGKDYQQQQQQHHHQSQNQGPHHDDNNDDDWLRF